MSEYTRNLTKKFAGRFLKMYLMMISRAMEWLTQQTTFITAFIPKI